MPKRSTSNDLLHEDIERRIRLVVPIGTQGAHLSSSSRPAHRLLDCVECLSVRFRVESYAPDRRSAKVQMSNVSLCRR